MELSYQRVAGLIDMVMIWVQYLTNGYFFMVKDISLMQALFKATLIRQGIILKLTQWIRDGVHSFASFYKSKNGPQFQLLSEDR